MSDRKSEFEEDFGLTEHIDTLDKKLNKNFGILSFFTVFFTVLGHKWVIRIAQGALYGVIKVVGTMSSRRTLQGTID